MPYYSAGARASFEPHRGETPAGRHLDLKPGHTRPAGGSGASPPGPLNATARLTAIPAKSATPTRSLNKAVICAWRRLASITERHPVPARLRTDCPLGAAVHWTDRRSDPKLTGSDGFGQGGGPTRQTIPGAWPGGSRPAGHNHTGRSPPAGVIDRGTSASGASRRQQT